MMNANESHLLLVDDDKAFLSLLAQGLSAEGYQVSTATTTKTARALFAPHTFSLVLLDLALPDGNGIDLLSEFREADPAVPVVMISGQGTIPLAVQAIKAGARDFLEKPLGLERALLTVRTTMERVHLEQKANRLKQDVDALLSEARERYQMVGASPAMQKVFGLIDRFAPLNSLVLITGETGVGKELAARAIHLNSKRAACKFVTVNCTNIPDDLLESSLFGHAKGAFTGAHADKIGYFQAADGGTLFLDEIGDLSLSAQAKILRVIEYGEISRVGDVNGEKVDVRLIAATNRDLATLVCEQKFREDLYYRLDGMNLHLPPLRERHEDVRILARYFLDKFCRENELPPKKLAPDAEAILKIQSWRGNVRELLHFMSRLAVFADGNTISSTLVLRVLRANPALEPEPEDDPGLPTLRQARENFERAYIMSMLEKYGCNITRVAEVLKIKRTQLYQKMHSLGINIVEIRAQCKSLSREDHQGASLAE